MTTNLAKLRIEFSEEEVRLLDEALRDWADKPERDGMMDSVMGSIFRGIVRRAGERPDDLSEENPVKREMEVAKAKALAREQRVLVLRARLMEALQSREVVV
jgi:hypothetical protein